MKRLIILFLAACLVGSAAANITYVTFRQQNGAERSLPLAGLRVDFQDGLLKASCQGEAFDLDLTTMQALIFASQPTGIGSVINDGEDPYAAQHKAQTTAYDLLGRPLSSINGQERGIYIRDGEKYLKDNRELPDLEANKAHRRHDKRAINTLADVQNGALVVTGTGIGYSYPFNPATEMTFKPGALVIDGTEFLLTDYPTLIGTALAQEEASVYALYDGATASLSISGELAARVSAEVKGANITVTDIQEATDQADLTKAIFHLSATASDITDFQEITDQADITEVTYHLAGTSTDGSFHQIGAYKCTISLEGISLESSACPFEIENGKRINILLTEGSQNTFRDGADNFRKSTFWIKGHPEFSGAGTLNLTGTQRHAYSSNEYTQLKNSFTGTINILGAQSDGMHVEQYYEQRNGNVIFKNVLGDNLDVSATTTATDEQNGQIIISGGTLDCTASGDDTKCVKSESHMTITGGTLRLRCTGDGSKGLSVGTTVANVGSGDLLIQQDPNAASNERPYIYLLATGDEYVNPADANDTSKCRGIKVKGNFTFDGGTIERDLSSTVKASKIISIDGTYTYKSGSLKNCSI